MKGMLIVLTKQSEKYIEHTPTVDVFYDASQSWYLTRLGKKASIRGLHVFARSVNLPSSTLSHLAGVRN